MHDNSRQICKLQKHKFNGNIVFYMKRLIFLCDCLYEKVQFLIYLSVFYSDDCELLLDYNKHLKQNKTKYYFICLNNILLHSTVFPSFVLKLHNGIL